MEVNIAVIGGGYWGKNLVRNFYELSCLHTVCDASEQTLAELKNQYQNIHTCTNYQDVLANSEVHAVVIAAPAELHYSLAKQALLSGKDVFVEKPLALDVQEGEALVALAEQHGRILMVGHLLQYHPAVDKLKELIAVGELGKLQYVYSNRLNFGKIRREENILWSFAPHDISVILSLLGEMPNAISATGSKHLSPHIEDTTVSHLSFPSGVKAHIFVSWLHPFKEQKLVVVGEKQMAVFDDTKPWEQKLVLYPHKVEWKNHMPQAAKAQGELIELPETEPLKTECQHFINSIQSRTPAKTDGQEGVNVLSVLNALQQSLDKQGEKVSLTQQQKNFFVHPSCVIDPKTSIGKNSKIWHFSHIMPNTNIGKFCSFGQNCVVGPNVSIGDNVKVQNNISIYDGVKIEDDVFLGPSMVFTNVTNPRSFIVRKNEFKKTLLKKGCSVGANATIVCGITLGEYSFIGAGAVVTKDVKPFALIKGVPGKQQGWVSKAGNKLNFNTEGLATDPEDGSCYRLENDKVCEVVTHKITQEA